jgi:hypothetical protein
MDTKTIVTGIGGIALGVALAFTSTVGGQTIDVYDDGVNPSNEQKVVITEVKQVEQTDIKFEGTLSDIQNEILPSLYAQREGIDAQIAKYEALVVQIKKETDKLPARKSAVEAIVE